MSELIAGSAIREEDSFFKHCSVMLLDEKQWSYLQRRYLITPRELEVAILVCQGFNNGEIAKALRIRRGTVKTHLRSIYKRVRVKNKITLLLRFIDDVNGNFVVNNAVSHSQRAETGSGGSGNESLGPAN